MPLANAPCPVPRVRAHAKPEPLLAKKDKPFRPKARLPKGLRDLRAEDVAARRAMLAAIMQVYESYGFDPLETSAFE